MTKCSKVLLKYLTICLDMKARNVFSKKTIKHGKETQK